MPTQVTQSFVDASREFSATKYYIPELDASNYAALFGVAGNFELVQSALAVATKCNLAAGSAIGYREDSLAVAPADQSAQREVKLKIQYQDTVNFRYGSMTIPAPIDTLFQANTDEVDIAANVPALALIAVLEANCVSQDDNPIAITRMWRIPGAR